MRRDGEVTGRRIAVLWAPMAFTWLMMALEGPFLAATVARLADPRHNLAAFGIAFAWAIIIEAPVIMILSASTALVDGPESFRRLRRFTCALNAGVTAGMLVLLLTPLFGAIARDVLGLPDRVGGLSLDALLLMLPWPAAIGYRRFYQGLLIRYGQTRRVAYGTGVRLTAMALTGLTLALTTAVPGALVGAAALAAGVTVEAVATRLMARQVVRRLLGSARDENPPTYGEIARFYYPLALTSMIGLAAHPVVTFFMGQARSPLESLAVLPVVNSLTFIFRAAGLSFQEVAISLLGRARANARPVRRFAFGLALAASAGLGLIAWTPLADLWFQTLSGLDAELTRLAVTPARILALMPAFSVLLSLQRAMLVSQRRTGPITRATATELLGIVLLLLVSIHLLDLIGATAAALAVIGGRLAANASLIGPVRRGFRPG